MRLLQHSLLTAALFCFQFVHEEALAYELAAHFYVELRDTETAIEYFSQAHLKYHEWGAFGKCDSLSKFIMTGSTPLPGARNSGSGWRRSVPLNETTLSTNTYDMCYDKIETCILTAKDHYEEIS